jgi:hypothetical protein
MDIGVRSAPFTEGAEGTPAIRKEISEGIWATATDQHVQNLVECIRTRKTPDASLRLGFQACLEP